MATATQLLKPETVHSRKQWIFAKIGLSAGNLQGKFSVNQYVAGVSG